MALWAEMWLVREYVCYHISHANSYQEYMSVASLIYRPAHAGQTPWATNENNKLLTKKVVLGALGARIS